jgi:ABC-2 type transport system permease protein
MFAGWLVVSPAISAVPSFLRDGLPGSAAVVLRWLPTGWPLQAVDAAAGGDVAAALGWLGALGGLAALAVLAAVSLLTPYVGNRTAGRHRRPLGSAVLGRGRSPLGAVVGKELRTWWRDPWRSLEVRSSIWFGVFLAAYGAVAGYPELGGVSGVAVALMVALSGANLFGQDGTALWLLVVGQSPAAVRADIRGRQLGLVAFFGPPALALSALLIVLTGGYDLAVPVLAVIVALLGAGSGVAVVLSVEAVTPGVDPHRRVNASDAGENGFAVMVALYATQLLVAPVVAMALPLALGAELPAWFGAATLAVAVLDGVAAGWVGGRIAARRLGSRLPETFARLTGRPAAALGGRAPVS